MAALAGDADYGYENVGKRDPRPYIIKNATQIYVWGLTDVVSGVAQPHVAGSGTCIAGVAVGPGVPGNSPVLDGFTFPIGPSGGSSAIPLGNVTTAAAGAANQVIIECGSQIVKAVTLTVTGGLNGTYTNDVGVELYCATSNIADASTTQTSTDKALGRVYQWLSYNSTAGTGVYDIAVIDYQTRQGY
jgi:hypothetical protein